MMPSLRDCVTIGRRGLLKLVGVILVLAAPAAAQNLLPDSFSGWHSSPSDSLSASQPAGREADVLRACGAILAEQRSYLRGAESLRVTLFHMRDPTSAYGAYSFLRPEGATDIKPTEHSSVARDRALLLVGDLLLEVSGKDLPRQAKDLKALASDLAPRANPAPYPTLVRYLPTRNLVPRSDRYVLNPEMLSEVLPIQSGDWLGFSEGAEAELARYRVGNEEATLLLAEYPTPQVAAQRLEELTRGLNLNPSGSTGSDRPGLFARRTSSLVALVFGLRSAKHAESLLKQVDYETEVTWNEPSFRLKEPGINQMLIGAFIGTGIILLFTLIASIAFGGVRLLVKHFFPGMVFDRTPTMEILQLGLTSKPIEAKDFY
jgi:uncharacterized protein DUF6599